MKTIDPTTHPSLPLPDDDQLNQNGANDAANLIRSKLDNLYENEPDTIGEVIESENTPKARRSKHQIFMANLAESGKPFAQIQTEWHEYYTNLPNHEKHEVWSEFYENQNRKPEFKSQSHSNNFQALESGFSGSFDPPAGMKTKEKAGTIAELKKQITSRVQSKGTLSKKQNLKSLGFGVGMGLLMVTFLLFGFFNERVIAPFITPSRNVSATPLILDPEGSAVGQDPKIIIPKINVEVPVVYDVKTVDEASIQRGLEDGVVHYATTSNPGEKGNGAIFGHSSNNILNKGKYKFAFVLLSRLENGDTFYVEKDGTRYVYKIFKKEIVSPDNVSVLNDVPGKSSTMALITCDPPGTTINRLVVWGEQISPSPDKNTASTAIKTDEQPTELASNPESLWSRIWNSIF